MLFLIIWLLCSAWSIYIMLRLELEMFSFARLGFLTTLVSLSLLFGPVAAIVSSALYFMESGMASRFFSQIIIDRRGKDYQ